MNLNSRAGICLLFAHGSFIDWFLNCLVSCFFTSITTFWSSCSWFCMTELNSLDLLKRCCSWACFWSTGNFSSGFSRLGKHSKFLPISNRHWWLDDEMENWRSLTRSKSQHQVLLHLAQKRPRDCWLKQLLSLIVTMEVWKWGLQFTVIVLLDVCRCN